MNKKDMSFCQNGPLTDKSPLTFFGKKARAKRKAKKAAKNQTNESVAENKANAPKANDAHERTTYIYNRKKEMGLI
tara:strand:- start:653 stop:880 length:228 start_codon:yes stop_codon:yes gene_type:complete